MISQLWASDCQETGISSVSNARYRNRVCDYFTYLLAYYMKRMDLEAVAQCVLRRYHGPPYACQLVSTAHSNIW